MYTNARRRARSRTLTRIGALTAALISAVLMTSTALRTAEPVLAAAVEVETPEFRRVNYGNQRVVNYETVIEYDDTMYSDEQTLLQSGVNGVYIDKIADIYYGDELVKSEVEETVTVFAKQDEIIRVGSLPGSRTDSRGYYIWPVKGTITSRFGRRSVSVGSSNHQGIDIGVPKGTDIAAADSGDVIFAGWASGYGNFIKIRHDNGDITCYGHLSKITVSEGDRVIQGDKIGEAGSTGVSTGSHLHFEIREGGVTAVNPLNSLPKEY